MLKTVNVLNRLIGAVHLTWVCGFYIQQTIPAELEDFLPLANKMGGRIKYLTIWANLTIIFYFWLALINDLISSCKDDKDQLLTKIKDFIFLSLVFPVTTFVSAMFWSLYSIDPDLVYPKRVEKFLPSWLNHSLHTAIFVYAVIELLTSYHRPSSKLSHLLATSALFGSYAIWFHIVYFLTGFWIYPVLSRLSWFGRGMLTSFSGLIAFGALMLGLHGNNLIWKNRVQECRKSKRK